MSVKPFTPEEAVAQYKKQLPSFVIEAANYLLSENATSGFIKITTKELEAEIRNRMGASCEFDRNWLRVDRVYSDFGWEVEYNVPDYTESFPPHFVFKRRSKPYWEQ